MLKIHAKHTVTRAKILGNEPGWSGGGKRDNFWCGCRLTLYQQFVDIILISRSGFCYPIAVFIRDFLRPTIAHSGFFLKKKKKKLKRARGRRLITFLRSFLVTGCTKSCVDGEYESVKVFIFMYGKLKIKHMVLQIGLKI